MPLSTATEPLPYYLCEHHTDAKVYLHYRDALSAAQGIGISATPQMCLAKPGWAIVVPWNGEPCYIQVGR